MLRTVRIEQKEYEALKAIAEKNGQHLIFLLTKAVRQFVDSQKKAQAA